MEQLINKAKKEGYKVYKVVNKDNYNFIYISNGETCIYAQKAELGGYMITSKRDKRYGENVNSGFVIYERVSIDEIELAYCFFRSKNPPNWYRCEGYKPADIQFIIKDCSSFGWKVKEI